jgi:pilus assembly protein CpaB
LPIYPNKVAKAYRLFMETVMKAKKFLPLVIALVLGLVATKVAMNMISQRQQQPAATNNAPHPQVVVAKRNIDAGEMISESDLELGDVASSALPDTVFKNPADLTGRVTVVPLIQGQAVLSTLLAPRGTSAGLQATVPAGMRALTIEINEFSGLAGYLTPGAHVDLLQTMRNDKTGDTVSRTIVQNVKIGVIGARHSDGSADVGRSVTLLVTPQEAEVIELASMTGRPRLVLRGANDISPANTHGVSLADLRGGDSEPAQATNSGLTPEEVRHMIAEAMASNPQAAPALKMLSDATTRAAVVDEQWTVRIVRGGAESDVRFAAHKPEVTDTNEH